jgi:hypothetical protein
VADQDKSIAVIDGTPDVATAFNYAHDQDDLVDVLMNTDPLHSAEQITGKSYKDDPETDSLGMAMFFAHNRLKEQALSSLGETHYNIDLDSYIRIVEDRLGGVLVRTQEFDNLDYNGKPYEDAPKSRTHYVYLIDGGAVLEFDSWWTTYPEPRWKINSANLYYNWRPNEAYLDQQRQARALYKQERKAREEGRLDDAKWLDEQARAIMPPHMVSSGGWDYEDPSVPLSVENPDYDESLRWDYEDPRSHKMIDNPEIDPDKFIVSGYHDAREGLVHTVERFRKWGSFMMEWVTLPFGSCFHLLVGKEQDDYYAIDKVDHDTAMSWPLDLRRKKAQKRRKRQDAAWDAHVETWPDEIKAIAMKAVEHERTKRAERRF